MKNVNFQPIFALNVSVQDIIAGRVTKTFFLSKKNDFIKFLLFSNGFRPPYFHTNADIFNDLKTIIIDYVLEPYFLT